MSVQRRVLLRTAATGTALATLDECGGGGTDSVVTTPAAPATPPAAPATTAVVFTNVSVHDPSVIKVADTNGELTR